MRAGLQPLWRPTLLRRLLGALLLAFAVVGVVLLALDFAEFKREMRERPAVQLLADGMVTSLAALDDARDATLVVQARSRELNHQRRDSGVLPGDVEFRLHDTDGNQVFATPGATTASGATHWVAEAQAGRWRLTLAEPRLGDATVLGWLGRELLGSLMLALPLMLLPVWWAASRGLRPLNELAAQVAARGVQDLSPLPALPKHDELRALATAFDALLARLRQQLQRERAFVQDAAHELRTPMAVVSAQAHLLATATDAPAREQARAALDQALQRAAHLSRQLLTLATLDEPRGDAAPVLDLASVVEHALAQLAPQALARGLELSLDAPATLPARLDRAVFESVLLNLVDNALRYVPHGGHVAVSLSSSDAGVELRVADDGPGIPPDQREAAFDRFWRGAAGHGVAGSGLGLAIVRQAALRLRGDVHVEAGLQSRGCSFIVRLPQSPMA